MELLTVKTEGKKNMENNESGFFSKKVITIFLVGVVIGSVGTWLPMRTPSESIDDMDKTLEENKIEVSGIKTDEKVASKDGVIETVSSLNSSITVKDQPAGVTVNIESVSIQDESWVVIHEDINGVLGNALGAQLLTADQKTGTVELLRGMEEGKDYYAVIRKDDGDRAFDLVKDISLSDKTGNPIQVKFKAIAN